MIKIYFLPRKSAPMSCISSEDLQIDQEKELKMDKGASIYLRFLKDDNGDGKINSIDASDILSEYAELSTSHR